MFLEGWRGSGVLMRMIHHLMKCDSLREKEFVTYSFIFFSIAIRNSGKIAIDKIGKEVHNVRTRSRRIR